MTPPDSNAFAAFIPGFEFLQNLTRQAAASGASGQGATVPGMPPMSHWVAPTFDVEELDKRIQDLKAVHFWLEQNTKALAATIQALEVQRMTLATLQGMNVSMQEMAEAFKAKPDTATDTTAFTSATATAAASDAQSSAEADASEPTAEAKDAKEAKESKASSQAGAGAQADPMQWWGALTDQFQTIAAGAMRDMNEQAAQMMAAAQAADAAAAKTKTKTTATKKAAQQSPAKSSKPAAKTTAKTAAKAQAKATTKAPAKKAVKPTKTASPKR